MTSSKKTRFLDAFEIDQAILEVARLARDQGARVALLGGAALQLYGSDRLTKDIDLASSRELEGMDVIQPLGFGGIQARTSAGVPVDLIVRDDDYTELYRSALFVAHNMGVPVPVVTAEYMVALKLAAGRDKDILDLKFLLLHADPPVDYEVAKSIVRAHLGIYAVGELDRFLSDFRWTEANDGRGPRRR